MGKWLLSVYVLEFVGFWVLRYYGRIQTKLPKT